VIFAALLVLGAEWPLSVAELDGKAWVYDARVEDTAPCSPKTKTPVELRLFTKVKQLRLTVKNCGTKAVKLLHDLQLQPSKLELGPKVKAPFDDRTTAKYDATVYTRSFTTLSEGEERVLIDETAKREGEAYAFRWGPFQYERIPLGKQKVRAVLDAWVDTAFDQALGKKVPVEDAALGSFKSNEVTLSLP
jgi:hypothetical protein